MRRLSPDVDRLFPVRVEPLEWADYLSRMFENIEEIIATVNSSPRKESVPGVTRKIAVEMAIRVLRVAKEYQVKIKATADPYSKSYSSAVKLLAYVGNAVDFPFMPETWWNLILIEARKNAPDLKL